jgi:acyl carrier protein
MRKNIENIIRKNFGLDSYNANLVIKKLEKEFDIKTISSDLDEPSIIELVQDFVPKNSKKIAHLNKKFNGSRDDKKFFEGD